METHLQMANDLPKRVLGNELEYVWVLHRSFISVSHSFAFAALVRFGKPCHLFSFFSKKFDIKGAELYFIFSRLIPYASRNK